MFSSRKFLFVSFSIFSLLWVGLGSSCGSGIGPLEMSFYYPPGVSTNGTALGLTPEFAGWSTIKLSLVYKGATAREELGKVSEEGQSRFKNVDCPTLNIKGSEGSYLLAEAISSTDEPDKEEVVLLGRILLKTACRKKKAIFFMTTV